MRRVAMIVWVVCLLAGMAQNTRAQSCNASASAISFGSVSPIRNTAFTATGNVTVTCTWPAITLTPNVQVCLSLGGTSPRQLANGSNLMQYDLFQNSGHSLAWGAIYSGTTPISLSLVKPATGTTSSASVTVYGQIATSQPTVPTVGNASTVYSQGFGGNQTSLNYGFYLLGAPTCASLTATEGTFPFSVSATVVNDCTINTTNVAFGVAGVLNNALSATGSITALCTVSDAYRIALNGGASANVAARQMQRSGGGGAVIYQLYLDSAHSSAWGDGTSGTAMATGTGTGIAQAFSVYGQVPRQTTPAPGSYSDTITATISF